MMYGKGKEDKKGMGYAKGGDTKAKKKKEPEAKDPALEYLRALRSGETDEAYLEMLRRLAEASTMSSERPKVGMKRGGMAAKGKKMGMAKGGMAKAGASNAATQKRTPKKG